jgi:hypothetical protein
LMTMFLLPAMMKIILRREQRRDTLEIQADPVTPALRD